MQKYNAFKHFVSLGANCYVAEDLKKLGLRNCSYPFDWLFFPDFECAVSLIENDFNDFLSYDALMQHENKKSRYYNNIYKFSFYHDFNKYESLNSQLSFVQDKYNRRINRLKKDICEPTLFFRYIISKNDVKFITDNYKKIDSLIKSFCPLNQIIYISHYKEMESLPINIFIIEKDQDDWISRIPLLKNPTLYKILNNITIENQESNKEYSKKTPQRFSIERFLRKFFKKEYLHSKIYKQ